MASAGRVLVVEDHETERRAISQILKSEGFTVFGAENADKAAGYIDENIDIVISDLNMGDVSGMDLLQLWKKKQHDTQFILVSGQASVSSAVQAMKNGAYDYLTKPINPDELILLIHRAIDTQKKDKEIDSLAAAVGPAVWAGSNRRPIQADERCVFQDPKGRSGGQHRAGDGGNRNRQGTGCPGAALQQPEEKGAVCCGQCRRRAGDVGGERAVRSCARSVYRGHRQAHRPV